jgi:transposase InsO family protein
MSSETSTGRDDAGLRREAVRRLLLGESPSEIARDLKRSRQWVYVWGWHYATDPHTDFTDGPRTPHHLPSQTSLEVERLIVALRKELEAGESEAMPYGLIGASEIQARLEGLGIAPAPSEATIQRILAKRDLTHALGAANASAYYPYPPAWAPDALHATDIVVRYLRRQHKVYNFHSIDVYTHRVALTPMLNNTSATACAHLCQAWESLGLPRLQQLDNEGAFCGGHTHPRVIGKVVRLCLFCGIEPFFTPTYEPKRNHWVENFHELWDQAFWSRTRFTSLTHQQAEQPKFERWYGQVYRPPALGGATIAQFTRDMTFHTLTPDLAALLPDYAAGSPRLPLTAGYIHLMRKVRADGSVELLNDVWMVGRRWAGEYVRASIDLGQRQIAFWYQADAESRPHVLLKRIFRPKEPIHELTPPFRRNCKRCRDCLPA